MEKEKTQKITTKIQGRRVVLIFADKANRYVPEQVKQMLLSNYAQRQQHTKSA